MCNHELFPPFPWSGSGFPWSGEGPTAHEGALLHTRGRKHIVVSPHVSVHNCLGLLHAPWSCTCSRQCPSLLLPSHRSLDCLQPDHTTFYLHGSCRRNWAAPGGPVRRLDTGSTGRSASHCDGSSQAWSTSRVMSRLHVPPVSSKAGHGRRGPRIHQPTHQAAYPKDPAPLPQHCPVLRRGARMSALWPFPAPFRHALFQGAARQQRGGQSLRLRRWQGPSTRQSHGH